MTQLSALLSRMYPCRRESNKASKENRNGNGWIDDRIEDWKAANGVTEELHWVGTWMSKMNMPPMPGMEPLLPGVHCGFAGIHTPEHLQDMEQTIRLIAQAGVSGPAF